MWVFAITVQARNGQSQSFSRRHTPLRGGIKLLLLNLFQLSQPLFFHLGQELLFL